MDTCVTQLGVESDPVSLYTNIFVCIIIDALLYMHFVTST